MQIKTKITFYFKNKKDNWKVKHNFVFTRFAQFKTKNNNKCWQILTDSHKYNVDMKSSIDVRMLLDVIT